MRKIKKFFAIVLIIPCLFFFTGCFENKLTVDVSGNYSSVASSTFASYKQQHDISLGSKVKVRAVITPKENQDQSSPLRFLNLVNSVELTAEYELNEQGTDVETCAIHIPLPFKILFVSFSANVYYKNGVAYVDAGSFGQYKTSTESLDSDEYVSTAYEFIGVSFINEYKSILTNDKIDSATITKAESTQYSGTDNQVVTEKFKVVLPKASLADTEYNTYEIYFVYSNYELDGIFAKFESNVASIELTMARAETSPTLPNQSVLDNYSSIN